MKITNFEQLVEYIQSFENKVKLAVVCAHDDHTLESVVYAKKNKLIDPILIGKKEIISDILLSMNEDLQDYTIKDRQEIDECIKTAVNLINENKASALMKGKLGTGELMKEILKKEYEIVRDNVLSVVGFFETDKYHKLFAVSDVGLNTYPNLNIKKKILENAVSVIKCFGVETPRVAVLAAVEKTNLKMPETVDASKLKEWNHEGKIEGCIVEGPISFDLATSKEAAKIKGYKSEVAGDADLLLVPDITSGNILAKCLTGFAGARTAGLVVGGKVPIVLTSRSAEALDKYYSIALAALAGAKLYQ